jgi:transcriptional regulator with GAF, ATPase, and Fis domain
MRVDPQAGGFLGYFKIRAAGDGPRIIAMSAPNAGILERPPMTRNVKPDGGLSHPQAQLDLLRSVGETLVSKFSRRAFFKALSRELRRFFHYDRLCINLYDSSTEILSYFSTVEGVVTSISPIRRVGPNTIAGKVIDTREPVVITNLSQWRLEDVSHPMADAGLMVTIAFPLIIHERIVGTLHCSFRQEPANLMEIYIFFTQIMPHVSLWVDHILAHERWQGIQAADPAPLPAVHDEESLGDPVYESPTMRAIMGQLDRVAAIDVPVLLRGETGTGKTMLAQYLHTRSGRKGRFIRVNCPSLVPTLFESEIFGHAKGAFTGALTQRQGRVEMARQGTLFLDEIGDLTPELQSKLLHVLEESYFERVGDSMPIQADFRLVAATNVDLDETLASGRLRRDLYYRMAAVEIRVPPLRERTDDIPVLARGLAAQLAVRLKLPDLRFTREMVNVLCMHSWPGNIRELRNLISRLMIQNSHRPVRVEDLRLLLAGEGSGSQAQPQCLAGLRDKERQSVERALRLARGTLAGPGGAAALLGLPRATLQYRIKKLGINLQEFRGHDTPDAPAGRIHPGAASPV